MTFGAAAAGSSRESSLDAFHKAYGLLIADDAASALLKPQAKRRRLASTLSTGASYLPASPSLPAPRAMRHSPGWFPYPPLATTSRAQRPYPPLNSFEGTIATSVSEPVPPEGIDDPRAGPAAALAPMLRRENAAIAAKLMRLAPPGPIGSDGLTASYDLAPVDPEHPDLSGARYMAWCVARSRLI